MKILIACEFSGIVRDAFAARGHDAWSADLIQSEIPGNHILCDHDLHILDIIEGGWDLMIAHPPCTHLAVSGARYFEAKRQNGQQEQAINFFLALAKAPIARIAIENPVCIMSSIWRKPDQIIQPWQFGHPESKTTCLWLKGLPKLRPTKILEPEWAKNPDGTDYRDGKSKRYSPTHYFSGRNQLATAQLSLLPDLRLEQRARWSNQTPSGQNRIPPSPDRWKIRSRTYEGIAKAMAEQWGAGTNPAPKTIKYDRLEL